MFWLDFWGAVMSSIFINSLMLNRATGCFEYLHCLCIFQINRCLSKNMWCLLPDRSDDLSWLQLSWSTSLSSSSQQRPSSVSSSSPLAPRTETGKRYENVRCRPQCSFLLRVLLQVVWMSPVRHTVSVHVRRTSPRTQQIPQIVVDFFWDLSF